MKGRMKRFRSIVLALLLGIGVPTAVVIAFGNTIVSEAATTYPGSSLDAYAYSGDDLGAVYTPEATTFKVWAPSATSISLKLYATGSDSETGAKSLGTYTMTKPNASNGVWTVKLAGDYVNVYYTYVVTTYGATNETVDIYAKAVGVNGNRGMIVDLDSDATNPAGWENDERVSVDNPTDAVIYELHVRDFSSSSDSGISAENKGKYLAFTESGTTLNGLGEVTTGLDYLKNLGINYVHLLPVYDYGSVDETKLDQDQYNWGYDPKNYNVPEGSYSTDPYDGNVRIEEFKEMVQSLHNEGIGVVMDVVYNHTYASEGSWFHLTEPGYYHRMTSTGTFWDGSGCGNETASERAMMRKYMIDSVVYWATEYHIDGFRFDLMGLHDVETMNLIRAALDALPGGENILMYGEGWTGGTSGISSSSTPATKANTKYLDSRIAVFSNDMRDAIKGDVFAAASSGFIQGNGYTEELKAAIQGNVIGGYGSSQWSKSPSQVITYTSAHDNYTLWDKLVATSGSSSNYTTRSETLVSMNKLSAAIVLTSQGTSFFQAGEEFARTKKGDDNSYASSTAINQLDWTRMNQYSDLVAYYQGLIELRKAFTPFRDSTTTSGGTVYYSWASSGFPSNVIAYTIQNKLTAGTEFNTVAVLFNGSSSSQTVSLMTFDTYTLPTAWVILVNGTAAGTKSLGTVSGTSVTIPAKTAIVLADKTGYETWVASQGKVTVNYVDEGGTAIATATSLTGTVGAAYSTTAKTVEGYNLKTTPDNATGYYTAATITVTYVYTLIPVTPQGTVNVKYVDEAGKEIAAATKLTGDVDSEYTATAKTITGYTLKTTPQNATGTYTAADITVTFEYAAIPTGTVTANYVDESGAVLATAETSIGNVGDTYTTTAKTITGYTLKATPDNAAGTYTAADITVDYVYSKIPTGTVNANYVDESGNVLATAETSTGYVGDKYTTTAKTITGYTLKATPDNAAGTYTASTITVDYVYTLTPAITVKYYNVNSWSTVYIYAYDERTGTAKLLTGAWPGTAMTYEGDGIWSYTFDSDVAYAQVIFTNSAGKPQEPAVHGYEVTENCLIKNAAILTYGSVTVNYVDSAGQKLADSILYTELIGESYTTAAKEIAGYEWDGVEPTGAAGVFTSDAIVVNYVYKAIVKANTITVKADGNGTVSIKDSGLVDTYTYNYTVGETVTIEAQGDTFRYWTNANNKVVSTEASFTIIAATDEVYTAMFAESRTVSFMSKGQLIKTIVVATDATEIAADDYPTNPFSYGHIFTGWDMEEEDILAALQTGDVIVNAVHEKILDQHYIAITGGNTTGSYETLTLVTVTADEPETGKQFSHWVDGDGNIMNYKSTYNFYVTTDIDLTAVFVDAGADIEKKVLIQITNVVATVETNKLSFTAERALPEGVTLVQHGIILIAGTASDKDAFIIGASGVLKGTATTTGMNGTYVLNKGSVSKGDTWSARGYVIYQDAAGEVQTVYGDIVTQTMP